MGYPVSILTVLFRIIDLFELYSFFLLFFLSEKYITLIFYSGFIFCIIFMDITSIELIKTHILVLFALFTILEFRVDRVTF
jgi:hypothetical protein